MRALAHATAPMDCEPLPPKYEQDNEVPPPPPEYDQKLLTEVQQCEEELPGNRHHSVQYGDQEDPYCELDSSESKMEGGGDTKSSNTFTPPSNTGSVDCFSKIESVFP